GSPVRARVRVRCRGWIPRAALHATALARRARRDTGDGRAKSRKVAWAVAWSFGHGLTGIAQGLAETVDLLGEHRGNVRIELRAAAAFDFVDRDLVRQRAPVSPVAGHGVVGVRHRDDARNQRDLLPRQAQRVPATVPAFVVQVYARHHGLQELDRVQDVLAVARVLLEDLVFGLGELAGLVQVQHTTHL